MKKYTEEQWQKVVNNEYRILGNGNWNSALYSVLVNSIYQASNLQFKSFRDLGPETFKIIS